MYRIEPRTNLKIPTSISQIGLVIDSRKIELNRDPEPGRSIWLEDNGATIVYTSERDATFKVLNGKEILVDPASIESEEEIGLNLLGPLLRLVLLQRGEFVLHASVVRIGERTASFIARSGRGKSTIAAAMYDRGHGVLSDDAGIVRLQSGPCVLAGPSVLKLHEADAARIDRGTERIFSDGLEVGKRFYHLTDNEIPDRTSLDAVYLIEQGNGIELEPVSGRDATVAFVENSWGLPRESDGSVSENLRRCSKLAEAVPVRRVQYPRSFDVFDDVLDRIEEDCNDAR